MEVSPKVQNLITKYTDDKAHIKLTVGLLKGDQYDYGVFNSRGKERVREPFFYEIGSITKTVTACMVLKKVAEGAVSLSDRIDKFIPELPKGKHYPSLFQLLTHTSGYGDVPKRYWFKAVMEQKNLHLTHYNFLDNNFTEKDLLDYIVTHNTNRQFGFRYSNVGYGVLGYVLGRIEQKLWKSLAQEYVINDLGMKETFVEIPQEKMLFGYNRSNINCGNFLWKERSVLASSGCLYSNVEDVLRYGNLHLQNSKSYFEAMHKPYGKGLPGSRMGLGFMIDKSGIFWHSGGTGGFHTFFGFHMRTQSAAVVLSNYAVDSDKGLLQEIGTHLLLEPNKSALTF